MYAALRSTILAQDPLPIVTRAYQFVAQEERLRGSETSSSPSEALAFRVDFRSKTRPSEDPPLFSYCQREGHDASSCLQVIGNLDWWVHRSRGPRGGVVARGGRSGRGRGGRGGGTPAHANKAVAGGSQPGGGEAHLNPATR